MAMTGSYPKAEVLIGPERRRQWSVAEKLEMVAQTHEAGVTVSLVTVSLVARRCGVSWSHRALSSAAVPVACDPEHGFLTSCRC